MEDYFESQRHLLDYAWESF
ncbi:hypothetical protein MTR67_048711 [Solanum verrucosum]|uniref:Uncharacterized protein n=1 Tax=Solanum verrucosum TaxID=315347 RepID=A0AAF0V1X6_SOLVR|nr:hypothetical protein MTR67_048711 [Solanum verrucosum]